VYLLYLDESGNESGPSSRHFVLGGLAIFERVTFFLNSEVEELQARHFPRREPIPFHASPIRSGKGFWRNITRERREEILAGLAQILSEANQPGVVLFAAVIEKSDKLYGDKAVEFATEQICSRFNIFLKRRENDHNDTQRGLLIFSEGRFDKRAKLWVRDFRDLGARWGTLTTLSDIPYFASMHETRLLQLADFVAHAVFLLYERKDPSLLRPFLNRFDQKEGVLHGLAHHRAVASLDCSCPACWSRRRPGETGPWI